MHDNASSQKGYVLVTLAFVIVILLGFAALAVDVGMMYAAHTSAQRAVDAAALAGANTFITAEFATDPVALAVATAKDTAAQNTILGAPIPETEVNVTVTYPARLVRVDLSHTIPTFFAGVLGQKFVTVAATGFAEGSFPSTACIKPWFIPNNIIFTPDPTIGQTPCSACQAGINGLIIQGVYPSSTVTPYSASYVVSQTIPGTGPFTVKPGNPSNALDPGQFFAIQLSNDSNQGGGDVYRYNIGHCDAIASNIQCGEFYSVKTGNMIGPTGQGSDDLITAFQTLIPDQWAGINEGIPQYTVNGVTDIMSRQVVIAPVWDVCSTICQTGGKLTGTNVQIQVVGFAALFINDVTANDVHAYLVGAWGCGSLAPPSAPNLPLRLVRID